MVQVQGKVLGKRKPLFADWSLPLPPEWRDEGGLTLRDVISKTVREQVADFRKRQQDNQFLRALTARQIQDGAAAGKIVSGQSDIGVQPVDEEAAVATALQAFEDGLYLVVIDELEQKNLDAEVRLADDSRITFLRLTLLAGG